MSPFAIGSGAIEIPAAPSPSIRPLDSSVLENARIVVVEDEAIIQMQLRRILTRIGAQIVGTANDGANGIQLVQTLSPDLTLMDVKMATDTDGLDAARQILASRRLCVVMLTAYEEFRSDANSIGACGYILKPIDSVTLIPQLSAAYRTYLDSNSGLRH